MIPQAKRQVQAFFRGDSCYNNLLRFDRSGGVGRFVGLRGVLMTKHVTGSVQIANDVLADLAGYSALESYGVVGMASPTIKDGLVQLLPAQKLRKGVHIALAPADSESAGQVEVDLYVVIEYGTQLAEVSKNLADRVRYTLTSMADVKVARVDVHVLEVKVR
jgi:uncharacterized alkaline shock family protein YloU